MRVAELVFLVLLVAYHATVLVPRHRRPFALNYLVFGSGIALALCLGLEGLRWQLLPGVALLLFDLLVLFVTFGTLRGRFPAKGFLAAVGRLARTFVASLALLLSVAALALIVLFPLPRVPLTGGLPVSLKSFHFSAVGVDHELDLVVWYPASGNSTALNGPEAGPAMWRQTQDRGGLPLYWQTYLEHLPARYVQGGRMAQAGVQYPVIVFTVPKGEEVLDFSWLVSDLASRGFIVVAAREPANTAELPQFSWSLIQQQLALPFLDPKLWLQPEAALEASRAPTSMATFGHLRRALRVLATEPGNVLFGALDERRVGWLAWGVAPSAGEDLEGLAASARLGDYPRGPRKSALPELWVTGEPAASDSALDAHRWVLLFNQLHRADLADAAYLKPYLAFFGLKSQPEGLNNSLAREYLAAFFQFALWGGDASLLEATNSPVAGVRLLKQ